MTRDEKIAKLGREITDYYATMLRMKPITPESPEYLGINSALKFTAVKYDQKMADDILDIALTMKRRVPMTFAQLKEKNLADGIKAVLNAQDLKVQDSRFIHKAGRTALSR